MARFFGEVGYGESVERPEGSGKWVMSIDEREYFGEVIRKAAHQIEADKVNNDIASSNSISIVADEFAIEHFAKIKYVRWSGVRWTVTTVEVRRPRLILNLGSVYNGPTP